MARKAKKKKAKRSADHGPPSRVVIGSAAAVAVAIIAATMWLVTSRATHPPFDENRAFADLETLASFGPRPPGSPAHSRTEDWIVEQLSQLADQVSTQAVSMPAAEDTLVGTNIVASFNLQPTNNIRIMLSTHWDGRPWADQDPDPSVHDQPVLGVNDASSGVAVLLEVARALAADPPDSGVDIILFDLEDSGRDSTIAYALGSEHFALNNPEYRPNFGINIDMVCDKDLRIPREANSMSAARRIVDRVFEVASELDADGFIDEVGAPIIDDHIPFLERRIPVINLIHSPFPDYWHTLDDTIENCSASSLGQVGSVLLRVVYDT